MTKGECEEITRKFVGGLVRHLEGLVEIVNEAEGEFLAGRINARSSAAEKFLSRWRSRFEDMEFCSGGEPGGENAKI